MLAFASLWAAFAATATGLPWTPYSNLYHPSPAPGSATQDYTTPWVQQLRNFRDLLELEAYRIPAGEAPPHPPAGASYRISPSRLSRPYIAYFADIGAAAHDAGYPRLAVPFAEAGRAIERLCGENRSSPRSRSAARRAAATLAATADACSDAHRLRAIPAPDAPGTVTYRWDDFRSLARSLAASLRIATRNAAKNRSLARGQTLLPQPLQLTLTRTWALGTSDDATVRPALDIVARTDGRGGSMVEPPVAYATTGRADDAAGTAATVLPVP